METVAAVGEALISTIFEGLLDKFTATSDLTNFAKNKKLDLELKKWHRILQSIKAVLADAEEKQVTNKTVRIWLTELRESAYEVEDVWDNLAYEAWKRKSKAQQQPRTKFEKLFIFPSGLKPNAVMFGVEMESKLKKITRRLQEIAKQKNELQLKEGELISMAYYKDQRPPTTTTSLVNQVNVFGREKDKEAILKLLLLVVDQKSIGNSSVCKIIVTTRNQNVSQITGNLLPAAYPLKELADDDCLSILACHVFGSKNFDAQPNLKEFGREIVKKCKGLPLAVKASAGLLRTKLLDKEHWEAALAKLEVLEIEGCKELTCLWPKRSELENMPCLKNLVIKSCPKLVSLVGEKEGLSCLSALKLKCLTIHDCMAMESLPDTFEMNDLEELEIFGCPSLIFFLEGKLPFTLKRLSIRNCRNIQCLLDGNKSHLEYLCIDDRLALESFLESGFQIPNLQIFHIFNINSLPNQMQKLTSLGELSLSNCEALESIPSSGLPPNITLLELCNCKNLKQPMLEWGLSKLNCLKELKITGACPAADMVSFPDDEGEMLPSTLTTLFMENMKNLESLSRGLRNLRDLEQLCMKDCPKLRTLPMTAMPVSLGRLYIFGCPLLQERCKKNRGEYWPIISHIPCLEID
ncbi:NB-ARC domain-containing protein [Corchorus olitorius]|uniref:NB-ARC domain-containing protein n=1 Tax=Corchorus olitorius TaxID=93759 RepID=A0A1R3IWK5_9ROSI|nr:NB-ARC domain-containing protein [Corchorus olitorius]